MYRCKKCGAQLADWRGHAEQCPQAGMPDSVEVAPMPTFVPQPYPYPVYVWPQYHPFFQPTHWQVTCGGTTAGSGFTTGPNMGAVSNTVPLGSVNAPMSLTAGGGVNTMQLAEFRTQ